MAFSQYLADSVLNWFKGTAFPTELSDVYISVHTADPGVSGTTGDVTLSIRGTANRTQQSSASFSAATNASGGGREITNTTVVQVTSNAQNAAPVTVTHFVVWDAITGGNFLASGILTSQVDVLNGDTVQFNVGAMAIRMV